MTATEPIDGGWLAWGQIVMQEQTITRDPAVAHTGADSVGDPDQSMTTGKYKVLKIYDPQYQEEFARDDLPPSLSNFQD